jgi:hypothetical protein
MFDPLWRISVDKIQNELIFLFLPVPWSSSWVPFDLEDGIEQLHELFQP